MVHLDSKAVNVRLGSLIVGTTHMDYARLGQPRSGTGQHLNKVSVIDTKQEYG